MMKILPEIKKEKKKKNVYLTPQMCADFSKMLTIFVNGPESSRATIFLRIVGMLTLIGVFAFFSFNISMAV